MSDTDTIVMVAPAGENGAPVSEKLDPELDLMFRAKVHVGYSRTRRHPRMRPYIFGLRNTVEIFNLEKVSEKIQEAEAFLKEAAAARAVVLLVGSKPSASLAIEKAAGELGMPYVANRWPGGLLTNFVEIRRRLDYFDDLKTKRATGGLARYTKKEQLVFGDELLRLERKFGGIVSLKKLPDVLVVVDPEEEETAIREARGLGIPSVGIANIDCDPELVTHVIPANDSAQSSISYVMDRLIAAYKAGLPVI